MSEASQPSAQPRRAAGARRPTAHPGPPAVRDEPLGTILPGSGQDPLHGDAAGEQLASRNGRARLDGSGDGLDGMTRAILRALCEAGASSPDFLAERLGFSRTSALQRLRDLTAAGLVTRQAIRHGVGRPRHLYDVTAAAQAILPANYAGLATTLLESIEAIGGATLVQEVFRMRQQLLAERIRARLEDRLGAGAPLEARVRELAVLQDDSGYVCSAEVSPDGTLELVEHNCAILGVAGGHPAACAAEARLFEDALDAQVTRISHIATGGRTCSYRIEPRG